MTTSKSSSRSTTTTTPAPVAGPRPAPLAAEEGQQAYDLLRATIRAVDRATVRRLTVNPGECVALVCAFVPSLRTLVGVPCDDGPVELEGALVEHALQLARAAGHLSSLVEARRRPPASVAGRIEQATAVRDRMFRWIDMAVAEGRLDPGARVTVSTSRGYADLGRDMVRAAAVLTDNWSCLAGFVALTPEDLVAATTLGRAVSTMAVERAIEPAAASAELDALVQERDAAFELLRRAWSRIQRRVQYLRFQEGDADRYAPSLFVHVTAGRRREATDDPTTTAPVTAAPAAATATAPTTAPVVLSPEDSPFES